MALLFNLAYEHLKFITITESHHKNQVDAMRILLLSDNEYLLGLFKGYCFNIGCDIKTITDCNNFYPAISTTVPWLIFIDMSQVPLLSNMKEWLVVQDFIKQNQIILCGFATKSFASHDMQSTTAFEKIFPQPFRENEILLFLKKILDEYKLATKDRRRNERRIRTERRANLAQQHATVSISDIPSIDHTDQQQALEEITKIGSLLINRAHKMITFNDIPIDLSHKEFKIIDYLAKNSGCVVETEEIIKHAWPANSRATKADVHQYMHMLRKKIEVDPHNPKLLITVKGFGYKLRP